MIFVVALIVVPTMYVNTVAGVLAIDPRLVEMGRVYRFPRRLLLTRDLSARARLARHGRAHPGDRHGRAGRGAGGGAGCDERHRPRVRPGQEFLETPQLFAWILVLLVLMAVIEFGVLRPSRGGPCAGERRPNERAGRSAPGRRRAEICAMIAFEHVSKSFDSLKVLNDLSFHISSGQIMGVVGPSGRGEDHHPQAHHRQQHLDGFRIHAAIKKISSKYSSGLRR